MLKSKTSLMLMIALLVLALVGLILLQAHLLKNAALIREQTFRQNVQSALGQAAATLQTGEAGHGIIKMFMAEGLDVTRDTRPRFELPLEQRQRIIVGNNNDTTTVDFSHSAVIEMMPHPQDSIVVYAAQDVISSQAEIVTCISMPDSAKNDLVRHVMADLALQETKPLSERVRVSEIDSVLAHSLRNSGLDLDYTFGVTPAGVDTLLLARTDGSDEDLFGSPYRRRLFPLDLLPPHYTLRVHFPNQKIFLWRQLLPLLSLSVVLILVVIVSFGQTIRTIIEQRRLAGQMVGFINNMTHEFKTPISTVALASEAIGRMDVQADPALIKRYNAMISDENDRMHKQVEKILQMAQLERGDYDLNLASLSVHDLIRGVVPGFSLQVEHRRGSLALELTAEDDQVLADTVHLGNVLGNLLDNAVKYSPQTPQIVVRTQTRAQELEVLVTDQGLGIKEQDCRRVFDKFYRCQTGNRHDVKGFGLGLSYVKLLTEAHGGRVAIESQPEAGTRVSIFLPLLSMKGSSS